MDNINSTEASSNSAISGTNVLENQSHQNTLVPVSDGTDSALVEQPTSSQAYTASTSAGQNRNAARFPPLNLPRLLPRNNPGPNDLRDGLRRARSTVAVQGTLEHLQQEAVEEGDPRQSAVVSATLTTPAQDILRAEELLNVQEIIRSRYGLGQETILAYIETYEYRETRVSSLEEMDRCSICLDDYIDGQQVGKLVCRHEFHCDCIQEWLNHQNTCPICRKEASI